MSKEDVAAAMQRMSSALQQRPGTPQIHQPDKLPVPCDARGVPLLRTLPDILGKLEDPAPATRAAGAHCIAVLIDGTSGEAAVLLGEYMRDTGTHRLLVRLLGGEQDERTNCWLLTALGNAASDVVDGNAATTRELLSGLEEVVPCVQAHLQSAHPLTRLYAAAAMQNLCKNGELAAAAVRGGAHRVLEGLCGAQEAEPTKHFAAGALVNIEAMLSAASRPRPGEAAHAAMEWRKEREVKSRLRKGGAKAGGSPTSSPAVPTRTIARDDELPERLEILTVQPPTEEALQTRIPLDVAKARSHAQRQRGRDELSASGRSADSGYDSPSSNSSWSFFTARSCASGSASVSAHGGASEAASEAEELSGSCTEV